MKDIWDTQKVPLCHCGQCHSGRGLYLNDPLFNAVPKADKHSMRRAVYIIRGIFNCLFVIIIIPLFVPKWIFNCLASCLDQSRRRLFFLHFQPAASQQPYANPTAYLASAAWINNWAAHRCQKCLAGRIDGTDGRSVHRSISCLSVWDSPRLRGKSG